VKFEDLKIKKLEFTIRYRSKMTEFPSRNKPYHIMGIQLSGSAEHYFHHQHFTINPNCVYFLNQKDDYDVKVLEPTEAFSVHFTTYEPIETPSFCVPTGNGSEIIKLLEKIEKKEINRSDELSMIADFYTLCSRIRTVYKKSYVPKDKRMEEIAEYIHTHFKDKDCLEQAAKLCSLTRRRFNDVFKQYYNITPNRYLIDFKIDLAKKLLKTEYLSVSEIAERCGFSDLYYFSKVFKEETGFSPSKY